MVIENTLETRSIFLYRERNPFVPAYGPTYETSLHIQSKVEDKGENRSSETRHMLYGLSNTVGTRPQVRNRSLTETKRPGGTRKLVSIFSETFDSPHEDWSTPFDCVTSCPRRTEETVEPIDVKRRTKKPTWGGRDEEEVVGSDSFSYVENGQ